jgi:hypothetical protein
MMYCPKCRSEFEDWVKTCPDCQVELVGEPPPPPDQPSRFNSLRELGQSLRNPRLLLILAGTAMFLAVCGAVSYAVAMAVTEPAADAWTFSGLILASLSNAIFLPGVLLGLLTIVVPLSSRGPLDPRRVFSLLVTGAIVVVLLRSGYSIASVEQLSYYPHVWFKAGTFCENLAYALFEGGVLLGLGYLCLHRAKALEPRQEIVQQSES